jgi:hypothetical protein
MPERVPICPTCNLAMELGFMPYVAGGGVSYAIPTWVAGEPVKSRWRGLKVEAPLQAITYRCPNCGYLASYARAPTP